MKITDYFARFIFNETYRHLYPMQEKEDICNKINTCDVNENTPLAKDILSLYHFALGECELNTIDSDYIEKKMDKTCYKNKRVKITDEETNKKETEKIRVEKRNIFAKNDLNKYKNQLKQIETDATAVEKLIIALENSSLTESQLLLCDKILLKNKIAKRVYIIALVAVIALPILVFLFSLL